MAFKKSIVLGLDSSEFDKGIDNANSKLDEFEGNLSDMEKKTDDAGNSLDDLGDSADNTAEAVVDMSQQFRNGIDILISVAQAVRQVTDAAMEYAESIQNMATTTGLSTMQVQELSYVAQKTGTDMETVASGLTSLEKAMASAASGSQNTSRIFNELGVSVRDANGNMRNSTEVFLEVINKLGEMQNSTERSQTAMQLFGSAAGELNGMIALGGEGILALTQEFDELGSAISGKDLQALTEAKQSIDQMKESFMAAAAELAATFAPAITAITQFLAQLSPEAKQTIMVIAALTAGVVGLGLAISAVGVIYTAMMGVMSQATAAFMGQAAPIMMVVAACAALALAIKDLIDTYREWNELTGGSFGDFLLHPDGDFEGSKVGRNARGTQYWRGGLTWVGEEGPELVDVPMGSRIYNNQESTSIGGNTYNVNMSMDMSKMKSINDVVAAVEGLKTSAGCRR